MTHRQRLSRDVRDLEALARQQEQEAATAALMGDTCGVNECMELANQYREQSERLREMFRIIRKCPRFRLETFPNGDED